MTYFSTQASDITLRRLAKLPAVLAAELGRTLIAHFYRRALLCLKHKKTRSRRVFLSRSLICSG